MIDDPVAVRVRAVRRAAFALLVGAVATGVGAQARLSDSESGNPSSLAPVLERLDEGLRQAVTSADDPGSRWISGQLETLDPAARARDFAAAAARAPGEMLYVASLARACLTRTVPGLPECDTRDAIASFVTRDADNAVPWLLLAERARQRRALPAVAENLERAARATRFDDYSERGAAIFAARIRMLPGGAARGTDVVAVALYTDRAAGGLAVPLSALCGPKREATGEEVTRACQRIAALLVERAPNAVDRALGASLAIANAPSDSARALAEVRAREIAVRRQRCAETMARLAAIAADPRDPAGARAEAAALAWPADRGKMDEIAACDRLAAAIATPR